MAGADIEHRDLEVVLAGAQGVIAGARRIAQGTGDDRTGMDDIRELARMEYLLDSCHQLVAVMRMQVLDGLASWNLRMNDGRPR